MFFVFVPGFMMATLLGSLVWARRDHQLVAPAVGPLEVSTGLSGEGALRGAVVAWRSIRPLVGVEARRLLRHPAPYLITVPFLALTLSEFTSGSVLAWSDDRDVALVVNATVPWAWGTLVAANLVALRSRRWRSEELLTTMPVPEASRTVAHLFACLVMVPGAAVLLAAVVSVGELSGRMIGTPRWTVLLAGPLLVVGAGCLGTAVARWLPRPFFGWVAVLGVTILQVNLAAGNWRWRWLHFSPYSGNAKGYAELFPDHHAVHLVYLLGGILLVVGMAVVHHGFSRRVGAVLVAAVLIMAATAVAQTRPIGGAQAAALAQRMEDPGRDQTCHERSHFVICADPVWSELVTKWAEPVEGVLARLTSQAVPDHLVLRRRPMIDARHELAEAVAVKVDPTVVWPNDDEVSIDGWAFPTPGEGQAGDGVQLSLAFRVASRVVGLPPDVWWSEPSDGSAGWLKVPLAHPDTHESIVSPLAQCLAADEARSVVAVWLAGQATPRARAELHRRAQSIVAAGDLSLPASFDTEWNYGGGFPDLLPEQGALVTGSDVVAGAALLKRDDTEVAAAIGRHWNEVVSNPARGTSSSDVLAWFDLDDDEAADIVRNGTPSDHKVDLSPRPAVFGPCPG